METTKMTLKEMKQAIKDRYDARPEKQIETGVYLKSIGRKYVTVNSLWGGAYTQKIAIADFYTERF